MNDANDAQEMSDVEEGVAPVGNSGAVMNKTHEQQVKEPSTRLCMRRQANHN